MSKYTDGGMRDKKDSANGSVVKNGEGTTTGNSGGTATGNDPKKKENNEPYFLKYDYISLRNEMHDNLKYQKELGWASIAAFVAFLAAVLTKENATPELCLLPLPILLFCAAKVKELKKSNIRIIKYMKNTADSILGQDNEKHILQGQTEHQGFEQKESRLQHQLWEISLYKEREEETKKEAVTKWRKCSLRERWDSFVRLLATSEYFVMGSICLAIYAMKTMNNCYIIGCIKKARGLVMFILGVVVLCVLTAVSWKYWRISGCDLKDETE